MILFIMSIIKSCWCWQSSQAASFEDLIISNTWETLSHIGWFRKPLVIFALEPCCTLMGKAKGDGPFLPSVSAPGTISFKAMTLSESSEDLGNDPYLSAFWIPETSSQPFVVLLWNCCISFLISSCCNEKFIHHTPVLAWVHWKILLNCTFSGHYGSLVEVTFDVEYSTGSRWTPHSSLNLVKVRVESVVLDDNTVTFLISNGFFHYLKPIQILLHLIIVALHLIFTPILGLATWATATPQTATPLPPVTPSLVQAFSKFSPCQLLPLHFRQKFHPDDDDTINTMMIGSFIIIGVSSIHQAAACQICKRKNILVCVMFLTTILMIIIIACHFWTHL